MNRMDDCRRAQLLELDDGAVVSIGLPIGWDDVVGHQRLAGVAADAQREGPLERVAGIQPPDGSPRLAQRRPRPRVALLQVHLHDGAVTAGVLHAHREVEGVGAADHVEVHVQAFVVAGHPACANQVRYESDRRLLVHRDRNQMMIRTS
jgi:hypothetical protein